MARYDDEETEPRIPQEVKTVIYAVIAIVCLIILLIIIFGSWYTIAGGYRGVILTFGKPSDTVIGEGLHFKIPLVQKIIKMDTRTQKYEAELTAASKDLQDVSTKIAINYRASSGSVVEIYRTIGTDYADKVIFPLEQESNKAATALFTAEDLIVRREEVRTTMERILTEKLTPRGIIVESISIVDFKFSPSFSSAIETKVTAEQLSLAAKNKLEQVKYEAEQRVVQAQGEADAIAVQVKSIDQAGGQSYLTLKYIEKWNGQVSVVTGNSVNPIVDLRGMTGITTTSATAAMLVTNSTR